MRTPEEPSFPLERARLSRGLTLRRAFHGSSCVFRLKRRHLFRARRSAGSLGERGSGVIGSRGKLPRGDSSSGIGRRRRSIRYLVGCGGSRFGRAIDRRRFHRRPRARGARALEPPRSYPEHSADRGDGQRLEWRVCEAPSRDGLGRALDGWRLPDISQPLGELRAYELARSLRRSVETAHFGTERIGVFR